MKDFWKTFRLAAYVFALPLVATAAVSAHQYFQQDDTISTVVVTPKTVESKEAELVGLNGTFRQHTIANNEDGQISGRVWFVDTESKAKAGLADTKVYFVREGKVVSQVYTDPDGTFDVQGLENGAYSFVVSNTEGVAVYGVNVVETADSSSMEVVIVSKNAEVAQKLIDENVSTPEQTELANDTVNGSNVAQLIDGELEGRLHSVFQDTDMTDVSVKLYDASNTLVGETTADAAGNFVISDLETGYYEFVASGTQGYAAFGFEAVEANEAYTTTAFQIFDTTLSSPIDSFGVSDCATCGDVVYGEAPVEFAAGCTSCSGAFSTAPAAPVQSVASSCGGSCGCGCGGGFPSQGRSGFLSGLCAGDGELTLLEKLRGQRTTREGIIPNNGCNPPCPNQGHTGCSSCAAAAPVYEQGCSSCSGGGEINHGSGTTFQDAGSGTTFNAGSGTTFDSGSVIYDPVPSTNVESVISTPEISTPPAATIIEKATEGSVVIPGAEGASNGATPVVDPSAFVIKTK